MALSCAHLLPVVALACVPWASWSCSQSSGSGSLDTNASSDDSQSAWASGGSGNGVASVGTGATVSNDSAGGSFAGAGNDVQSGGQANSGGGTASGGATSEDASSGGGSGATVGGASGSRGASGGAAAGSSSVDSNAGAGGDPTVEPGIHIDGRQVIVDGEAVHLCGVCWNPVPAGAGHPEGIDYAGYAAADIPLMQAAGINAIRTYEPLTDAAVLDRFADAGIGVLNGVYPYGGSEASVVRERIAGIQDHPAILMWVLGNEWNYNGLYVDLSHADSLARLNEVAALLRAANVSQPIATIYGELPTRETIEAMPDIDVWGINAYRGISFGTLLSDWEALSDKPMLLGEYGADAYNANLPGYDPDSQAEAVAALTDELIAGSSALAGSGGIALGGMLFEWADEWWKDEMGSLDAQDVGGIAPGAGPYPDQTFNEEWWGIVDIDRQPRAAYDALAESCGQL